LFEVCSAHVRATSPPPDVVVWSAIADPEERLTIALGQLDPYFRRTAGGWAAILRDAEIDSVVQQIAATRRLAYLEQARECWP
jgi:hypothetical protein